MDGKQNNPAAERQSVSPTPQNPNQPVYNPPSLVEPAGTTVPASQLPVMPAPVIEPKQEQASPATATAPTAEGAASGTRPAAASAEPVQAKSASAPSPASATQVSDQAAEPETAGFYKADEPVQASSAAAPESHPADDASADGSQPIVWTASGESLQAHASGWRLKMSLVGLICAALVYLWTRDLISTGAVAFGGILFGLLGSRKPRPLQYRLDERGITIGVKHFRYAEFRAFSVTEETASINLVPLKRFLPLTAIHFDRNQAKQIVQYLSERLPMEAPRRDMVDNVLSGLRF